jgi:hypothetical protein
MSLDVSLINKGVTKDCECCGQPTLKDDEVYSGNITHNLTIMSSSAGLYQCLWRPEELNISKAVDLIKPLQFGLKNLKDDPYKFDKLNPENGWGSYAGLVRFVESYLQACIENPEATIEISR